MGEARVRFVLDGNPVEAAEGLSLLEAAENADTYIPRLCAHPELRPHGSCRVCTCLVNGRPQSACTTTIAEGMVVESESARILELRRSIVEMMLVEGNHFCMVCERSGSCELQAVAYRLGIVAPRHRHLFARRPVDHGHAQVYFDRNRCILCGRCARAARELDHSSAFAFVGRGARRHIAVNAPDEMRSLKLRPTDAAVAVCPVGALLPKHQGYLTPIGQRKYDHWPIGMRETGDTSAQE